MKKLLLIVIVLFASCSKDEINEIESTKEAYIIELYDISKLKGLWQLEVGNSADEIHIGDTYFKEGSAHYTMEAVSSLVVALKEDIRNRFQKLYTKIEIINNNKIKVYYYSNGEGTSLYSKEYVRN